MKQSTKRWEIKNQVAAEGPHSQQPEELCVEKQKESKETFLKSQVKILYLSDFSELESPTFVGP